MTITLSLNLEQLVSLIDPCNLEEKILLIRRLETETFETRFKRLLDRLRTDELSLPEITQEVESVRQERYRQHGNP
jgi:hypothetical protein